MISLVLLVKCWMRNVFPNARSAKLQIVRRLNMSKTAMLDTFTITCTGIVRLVGGYSQGGSQLPSGACVPPPHPLNESLHMYKNTKAKWNLSDYKTGLCPRQKG